MKDLLPDLTVVKTPRGTFLAVASDKWITRSLVEYGEYSEAEPELWKQFLAPGDLAFDVGANIGYFSVRLGELVGPDYVVAIEPMLPRLCAANLILNTGKANLVACALSDGDREVSFSLKGAILNNNWGSMNIEEDGGFAVEAITLDELCSQYGTPRFIKIDVEGHELEVLKGSTETLKHHPFLYFENDRVENSEALLGFVIDQGYRCYWHIACMFRPDNANSSTRFTNVASINVLGVPKGNTFEIKGNLIQSAKETWQDASLRIGMPAWFSQFESD